MRLAHGLFSLGKRADSLRRISVCLVQLSDFTAAIFTASAYVISRTTAGISLVINLNVQRKQMATRIPHIIVTVDASLTETRGDGRKSRRLLHG